jgi:hypothetical protein
MTDMGLHHPENAREFVAALWTAAREPGGPGSPEARRLAEQLELVLVNDEIRSEWSALVRAETGSPSGRPWIDAGRHIRPVLGRGLGILDAPALRRLALDLETIHNWSQIILDTLSDPWWEALLVHGRRFSPPDESEPRPDAED